MASNFVSLIPESLNLDSQTNFIGYENHYLYKIKNQQFREFQKKILAFELEINKINYEKLFSRLF